MRYRLTLKPLNGFSDHEIVRLRRLIKQPLKLHGFRGLKLEMLSDKDPPWPDTGLTPIRRSVEESLERYALMAGLQQSRTEDTTSGG